MLAQKHFLFALVQASTDLECHSNLVEVLISVNNGSARQDESAGDKTHFLQKPAVFPYFTNEFQSVLLNSLNKIDQKLTTPLNNLSNVI